MRTGKGQAGLALLFTAVLAVSLLGAPIAGATATASEPTGAPTEDLSYSGDAAAPNPMFKVDSLTVARHPVSKGVSHADMAGVFNDNGEWVSDTTFAVNTTSPSSGVNENPYTFKPGHIDDPDFGLFPRTSDGDASALDADEWSKTGQNASELSLSDTEVAEGVNAANFNTGGTFTSGDVATASYSNWTSQLDSDESKRVLQIAADVNTLDSGTVVEINITDETGDVKQVYIDSSMNTSANNVLANTTGDSFVEQVRLADLSTVGGGSWNNIEYVNISVADGDFDGSISWLDLESKSKDKLGVKTVDSDGDGNYDETKTHYDASGAISVNKMSSLGNEFDNAVLNDVSFPAHFEAKMLKGSQGQEGVYRYSWDSAGAYPAYDTVLNVSYRMELPGYIELSYSGVSLVMAQNWNAERYASFGYAEGVSSTTKFKDVSTTSLTSSLGGDGDTVTIDDTVQTDTGYVVTAEIKMVNSEKEKVTVENNGSAPPTSSNGDGGIIGFIMSIPGMLMTIGGTLLGFRWLKG